VRDLARLIFDSLGWIGAVAVMLPYTLAMFGRMKPTSVAYKVWNLVGSLLLILNTGYHRAYPSAVVNVVWSAIAIVSLIRPVRDANAG
jgi:hypothetical protein